MNFGEDQIVQAIQRLENEDLSLELIYLQHRDVPESASTKLLKCLITHNNVVSELHLGDYRLTDETGVLLAKYIAVSSSIAILNISHNKFSETTYSSIATALCVNTTLAYLRIYNTRFCQSKHIDFAFVNTLHINPLVPDESVWILQSRELYDMDFPRLKAIANKSTAPSMLEFLLYVHLNIEEIK